MFEVTTFDFLMLSGVSPWLLVLFGVCLFLLTRTITIQFLRWKHRRGLAAVTTRAESAIRTWHAARRLQLHKTQDAET